MFTTSRLAYLGPILVVSVCAVLWYHPRLLIERNITRPILKRFVRAGVFLGFLTFCLVQVLQYLNVQTRTEAREIIFLLRGGVMIPVLTGRLLAGEHRTTLLKDAGFYLVILHILLWLIHT